MGCLPLTRMLTVGLLCRAGFGQLLIMLAVTAGTLLGALWLVVEPDWFGAGRYRSHVIPLGEAMPAPDTDGAGGLTAQPSAAGQAALVHLSERSLPDWQTRGKVTAPRIVLARLVRNHEIEETNRYLLDARPWSGAGSTWTLHDGDYDFTLVTLTTILYMFGDQPDRLYPETRRHLLDILLTEEGGTPLIAAPNTLGLILDTENHHLMTEGSRYLKNQWLALHGTEEQRANPRYDNRANGLEDWLLSYLEEMISEGVYEFNSRPYLGYTLQALLNLEAYPKSARMRKSARYLLDIINLQYALGSLGLRSNPPFRRQYRHDRIQTLNHDPHTAFMHIWTGAPYDADAPLPPAGHRVEFRLLAELLPYRPPKDVVAWTLTKAHEYFVRYGRGASACPEIYSGGPDYLLSAGGANRGFRSHIVARPITLLLNDGETDMSRCLYLSGAGAWRNWNSTGVFRRFACANGPAHIPGQMTPEIEDSGWLIFTRPEARQLLTAVYSTADFSLIALFPDDDRTPAVLLDALLEKNPEADTLRSRFVWPDGQTLAYDVDARKGTWVMKSANGRALDRNYDAWPQLAGDVPDISFTR